MSRSVLKYIFCGVIVVSLIMFSFVPAIEFLINFSNDDSFFYIKTAYNFSTGEGSTFDLVNKTNGYHPLWFLVLALYFYLINFFTEFSPEFYFRMVTLLINIINAATLYLLYRFFKSNDKTNFKKQFFLIIPLFLTFVAYRDYGMETHLVCLLMSIYLFLKSTELSQGSDNSFSKIIIVVLIFLTRTDYLLTVIPIMLTGDYLTDEPNPERKRNLRNTAFFLAGAAAVYFGLNYYYFGEFISIASKIKSSVPEIIFIKNFNDLLAPGTFTNQFIKSFYVFSITVFFSILILFMKYREKIHKIDYFLFSICLSALIFIIFNLCFNKYTLKEWYVAFPTFVCSILLTRLIFLFPKIYKISLTFFIILFLYYFNLTRLNNPKWDSMYRYALELKEHTDPKDRILMIDLSGIVGFFSERKIINGDGLINSFEYWNYKNSDKLKEFIDYKKINMYSTYSTTKGNHEITDSSGYLTDKCYSNTFGGYSFTFPKEDLIFKAPYYYFHAVNSDTGYWYLFKID